MKKDANSKENKERLMVKLKMEMKKCQRQKMGTKIRMRLKTDLKSHREGKTKTKELNEVVSLRWFTKPRMRLPNLRRKHKWFIKLNRVQTKIKMCQLKKSPKTNILWETTPFKRSTVITRKITMVKTKNTNKKLRMLDRRVTTKTANSSAKLLNKTRESRENNKPELCNSKKKESKRKKLPDSRRRKKKKKLGRRSNKESKLINKERLSKIES